MKRIERWLTAGIVAIVLLTGISAQVGFFNPAAVGGALFGTATGIDVPALDDPAMIRRGAAHYDRVCATCHASPDRPNQAETLELTPPPPKLHLRADGWPAEVLFAIIKHGIKNTAMPAWPTQNRDDEVWDMVAFISILPTLDATTYRALAGLDHGASDAPPVAVRCIQCHGVDGRGFADGAFPRLDIQSDVYLLSQLEAFRDEERLSGFMQSAVDGLHAEELAALAEYFASDQPPLPAPTIHRMSLPTASRRGRSLRAAPAMDHRHLPARSFRP
jgi:cytochrome c553